MPSGYITQCITANGLDLSHIFNMLEGKAKWRARDRRHMRGWLWDARLTNMEGRPRREGECHER